MSTKTNRLSNAAGAMILVTMIAATYALTSGAVNANMGSTPEVRFSIESSEGDGPSKFDVR